MKRNTLALGFGSFFVLAALVGVVTQFGRSFPKRDAPVTAVTVTPPPPPTERVQHIGIESGRTFGELMKEAGVSGTESSAIYASSKDVYDLAAIREGKTIDLVRDISTDSLKKLVYAISTEEELYVEYGDEGWTAKREAIEYEIKVRTGKGTVESSLYAAGLADGLDERVVIALADVFQWTFDFAQDVRVGDTFRFTYEELWRDGTYVMPGRVLVAEYVNDGTPLRGYLFKNAKGEEIHYDENGGSLRKMFLKAPVAFKYITSGYTTGMRYVSAFNTATGHRAIDYATPAGTPIRATADGTVVTAGWNGPYGNFVSIRHNATYTTNYAHQSRIAVRRGQRVTQGQIIGYVGSTGFSTGPHLHYEMVKNGVKINPLRETFPSTEPVTPEELEAFKQRAAELNTQLPQ